MLDETAAWIEDIDAGVSSADPDAIRIIDK
jgi:hypothetical protein